MTGYSINIFIIITMIIFKNSIGSLWTPPEMEQKRTNKKADKPNIFTGNEANENCNNFPFITVMYKNTVNNFFSKVLFSVFYVRRRNNSAKTHLQHAMS